MPPGRAAAVASGEYQVRNNRSMNHMIDQKQVCTISGRATARTSRPPQGRDHQSVGGLGFASRTIGTPASIGDAWGFELSPVSSSTLAFPLRETRFLARTLTRTDLVRFAGRASI